MQTCGQKLNILEKKQKDCKKTFINLSLKTTNAGILRNLSQGQTSQEAFPWSFPVAVKVKNSFFLILRQIF